jgi:L-threonylcarbamoyladenylate synthase
MVSSNEISKAAEILRRGGLVAFPTETVYGLGADATSDLAVAKVYEAKGRPSFNPLIVHVTSLAEAKRLGRFDESSERLAREFWPGPLTLVVPRADDCPVSLLASAGLDTIALRVPKHDVALALLREFGKPVVAPSANPSGLISPTTAQHVRDGLGDKIDMVLNGGDCAVGVESTVIFNTTVDDDFPDCREPYLLRAGGIERVAIEKILGRELHTMKSGVEFHSPGQLASHYAPRASLRLDAAFPDAGEIFLGFGDYARGPYSLSPRGDLTEAAANLFRLLHEIDATGADAIAVAPIPHHGLGEAINDRLQRAAAPRGKS